MSDAYNSLEAFYITKDATAIDGTDFFLLGLFQGENTEVFFDRPSVFSYLLGEWD